MGEEADCGSVEIERVVREGREGSQQLPIILYTPLRLYMIPSEVLSYEGDGSLRGAKEG